MNNITNDIYNQEPTPAPNVALYETLIPIPNVELDEPLPPELERLNYRMKISSGISQIAASIRDVQARNRFLACYRHQHGDERFSYNLFGKSWKVGDRKLSFKEYKKLSDTYDFPSVILEIIDERFGDRIQQARVDAFKTFAESEEL